MNLFLFCVMFFIKKESFPAKTAVKAVFCTINKICAGVKRHTSEEPQRTAIKDGLNM